MENVSTINMKYIETKIIITHFIGKLYIITAFTYF